MGGASLESNVYTYLNCMSDQFGKVGVVYLRNFIKCRSELLFCMRLTVLCKLVVSLQMQNRKTTDKINEISIVPNPPNYSIVAIADQRALHLHFATDNQLAKPCMSIQQHMHNNFYQFGFPVGKLTAMHCKNHRHDIQETGE